MNLQFIAFHGRLYEYKYLYYDYSLNNGCGIRELIELFSFLPFSQSPSQTFLVFPCPFSSSLYSPAFYFYHFFGPHVTMVKAYSWLYAHSLECSEIPLSDVLRGNICGEREQTLIGSHAGRAT